MQIEAEHDVGSVQRDAANGAETLLAALQAGGAEICFANPGTTELTLVSAFAQTPGIRPVLCLFEGVCTGAADGYARVSGKTPLTLTHLGPGFANGIANLHNARRARSGIINLIGDHATWHLPYDAPLTSDIESLARPVSELVLRMSSPAQIGADVAQAYAVARGAPGGSVTLIAPTDVMDAKVPTPVAAVPEASAGPRPVAAKVVEHVAAVLRGPARVILLVGGEALSERAVRCAGAICAATDARLLMEPYPAIVTLGGDMPRVERQAYFPDDVIRQMESAVVILVGARAPISYFGYENFPSQLVPDERLVTLSVPGEDSPEALEALASMLAVEVATAVAPTPVLDPVDDAMALSNMAVVDQLIAQLPEGAIISLEGSTLGAPWLREAHRAPRHRVMTNTGGAIGQGLPCAAGAALAAPGRRIVSLQSDGSAHYTLQALWTLARERLPVTIILAANHRYGILQLELTRAEASLEDRAIAALTRLDNPRADWTALAAGYGVPARRATTVGEFRAALAEGLATDGPLLIQAELP